MHPTVQHGKHYYAPDSTYFHKKSSSQTAPLRGRHGKGTETQIESQVGKWVQLSRVNLPCSLPCETRPLTCDLSVLHRSLHCYVTLSGARSGGEMCRNFSAESEFKLFWTRGVLVQAAPAFQLHLTNCIKLQMTKLLNDDGGALTLSFRHS